MTKRGGSSPNRVSWPECSRSGSCRGHSGSPTSWSSIGSSDLDAVGDANSEARNLALGLLADCSTKIVYAQEAGEASKTGGVLGLSSTEMQPTPRVGHGRGSVEDR